MRFESFVMLSGALLGLGFGISAGVRLYQGTRKLFGSLAWGISVGVMWIGGAYLLLAFYFLITFRG